MKPTASIAKILRQTAPDMCAFVGDSNVQDIAAIVSLGDDPISHIAPPDDAHHMDLAETMKFLAGAAVVIKFALDLYDRWKGPKPTQKELEGKLESAGPIKELDMNSKIAKAVIEHQQTTQE